jgi:hypothetical protein
MESTTDHVAKPEVLVVQLNHSFVRVLRELQRSGKTLSLNDFEHSVKKDVQRRMPSREVSLLLGELFYQIIENVDTEMVVDVRFLNEEHLALFSTVSELERYELMLLNVEERLTSLIRKGAL